jgi:hypothetical protein
MSRAMAQVVSRRPPTAETRVLARVSPCGICGIQSGTGIEFSPSSSYFPCQYHSDVAHILSGRLIIGPLVIAAQRQSHPIDTNIYYK